jgi:peptide chain release factor 2
MASPGFWNDQERAQAVTREAGAIEETLGRLRELERVIGDLEATVELAREEEDDSLVREGEALLKQAGETLDGLEIATFLDGDYDDHSAIMTLHAGAGGTEAMDWVEMLARMYTRWAEDQGFRVEVLDRLEGEEAGLKSVTMLIEGPYAYGLCSAEHGVHRLVRISPFDSSGRRHTSFASVDVVPDIKDDADIEIDPEDLRVDTYRSSGAGGQHVNKTDSAVRLTHLPTGVVVTCQNERSQHANRETAMRILKSRLLKLREEERQKELAVLRGEQHDIAWGSQIRSYVFQPYTLVKDHRTGEEVGDVGAVMNGRITPFIKAYLARKAAGRRAGTPGMAHGRSTPQERDPAQRR